MALWDSRKSTDTITAFSPLEATHRQRAKEIAIRWDYYRGRHRKPLVIKPGQPDDNVVLNYSRRVVNKGLSFLFGGGVEFEIDGSEERGAPEQYLDDAWGTMEQKQRTLLDLGMNGAVAGTGFVRLYEPAESGAMPRIVAVDPSLMDIIWNPDDIEDIRAYHMVWRAGEIWRRQRADRLENGTWSITDEETSKANVWTETNEAPWPYQFAPFFMCQNLPEPNDVWGISDLEEADINDAINWTASNINRILRFHAHPKTIGTGFAAERLRNTSVDQFWSIEDAEAKVYNLEMKSDLASAYQMLMALKETYAKVTGVPDLDPDKVNVGALSGFALRILYSDLMEQTDIKRVTYGALLADVNAALLTIGGFGEEVPVNNVWQEYLPQSDTEQVQALTADRANGLSLETYLERRGYDAARESERLTAERAAGGTLSDQLLRQFETGV